jgi:hypothetical protein
MTYKYESAGVYRITNTINQRFYIGSSVRVLARIRRQIHDLNHGTNPNPGLQADWLQYGPGAFQYEILETCEPGSTPRDREQTWISQAGQGAYNIHPARNFGKFRFGQDDGRSTLVYSLDIRTNTEFAGTIGAVADYWGLDGRSLRRKLPESANATQVEWRGIRFKVKQRRRQSSQGLEKSSFLATGIAANNNYGKSQQIQWFSQAQTSDINPPATDGVAARARAQEDSGFNPDQMPELARAAVKAAEADYKNSSDKPVDERTGLQGDQ